MIYHKLIYEVIMQAVPLLRELEPGDFSAKPAPDKWSKSEILGHLLDSAIMNFQRFVSVSGDSNLIFSGYDQELWVRRSDYINYRTNDLIHLWANTNSHLGEMIRNIPDEILFRKSTEHNFDRICMNRIPADEPASLNYLIWDYVNHMEHHLSQICDNYIKKGGDFIDYNTDRMGHSKSDN